MGKTMLRLGARLIYANDMDKDCESLCDALNSLPGVVTTESCSGHGRIAYKIWFRAVDPSGLFFLTRCIDRRYWQHGASWHIVAVVGDAYRDGQLPIGFCLEGQSAHDLGDQVRSLIDNLNDHLNHKNFIQYYNIDLSKFVLGG